jgi:hypothetical protein
MEEKHMVDHNPKLNEESELNEFLLEKIIKNNGANTKVNSSDTFLT